MIFSPVKNRPPPSLVAILLAAAAVAMFGGGCGSGGQSPRDGGDGGGGDGGAQMCTYADGGMLDGGAFNGVCPDAGCPAGTACVTEIGGVAGGGGEYCAPIPNECHGAPTCACMATCVCTNGSAGRPETCTEQNGSLFCDNGIR